MIEIVRMVLNQIFSKNGTITKDCIFKRKFFHVKKREMYMNLIVSDIQTLEKTRKWKT